MDLSVRGLPENEDRNGDDSCSVWSQARYLGKEVYRPIRISFRDGFLTEKTRWWRITWASILFGRRGDDALLAQSVATKESFMTDWTDELNDWPLLWAGGPEAEAA